MRAATLCLINKIRVQHGELPLLDNGRLDNAAQGHSEDMVAKNYFEHTSPSGEKFDTRIAATGYVPAGWAYELGENIDYGTLFLATPSKAVEDWMHSPEHRANILNGEFRESGVGVAPAVPAGEADGQPGATYTQDFGVLASG
ncbi:MAG TPA: CAP domain-containing protein [Gaiellales bacterium]|nr:CAP domain-containing protein [Gaiellales bacterium]